MASAEHTISSTRTRTLLIIIAVMLFIAVWVAIYSFSKGSKEPKTASPTSGIPNNIYVTPGSKSSEKYVELQQAANVIGTKKADSQGKTFIPTIIGNKADDLSQGFNNQLADILKEKAANGPDNEKLSKQLASLLAELNSQGKEIDNLLKLIRELQSQGYDVSNLAALLKKLQANGYNTAELEKLLATLKNQGYAVEDLEKMLKRLLTEGYNPDLINKILEQLLKDRLKALEDSIKKLQNAGFETKDLAYLQKQLNNPALTKLLEQLANQGYKVDSLENLLKQLMDKGYNVFDMQIMLQQLQKDGYDVNKLQDLINQQKMAGVNINDLKSLIDALTKKNLAGQQSLNDLLALLQQKGADIDQLKKLLADLQNAGYSKADLEKLLAELIKKNLNPDDIYNELLKKLNTEHHDSPIDAKTKLSNILNSHKSNQNSEISDADKKYADLIKKQQEKALAEQKAKRLAEEAQTMHQKSLINSEAKRKDMEAILANMSAQADTLAANATKIPPQSFVQGSESKESTSTSTATNQNNIPEQPNIPSSLATNHDTILKAGTILFAVLETAVNSDEPGPILARIVQPPLQNTTILGSMQTSSNKYAEGILLSFSTANIPDRIRSYGISAIAIDPNTARTAIASDVDHHYLLRWGTIFAATFLQGYSKAVAQSGTTVQSSTNGAQTNSTTTQSPLSPKQQIYQGIGDMATAWGQGVSSFTTRPTTITINPGTSLGILLTSDFTIPSSDEIPTEKEPISKQQINAKSSQNNIMATNQPIQAQQVAQSNTETTSANQNTINNNSTSTTNNASHP